MFIIEIFQNHLLVNALLGWLFAQVIKAIIAALQTGRFDWHKLHSDGGMPSCHSATVVSLAISAGIYYGFESAAFGLSTILAIIVMHDAMGVRQEAGKHARLLNKILTQAGKSDPGEAMKEFLGHTPLQVLAGGLIGAGVGLLFSLVVWPV